ncbi:MAG: hypothetical protein V3U92_10865 [Cellulophaga sp.]
MSKALQERRKGINNDYREDLLGFLENAKDSEHHQCDNPLINFVQTLEQKQNLVSKQINKKKLSHNFFPLSDKKYENNLVDSCKKLNEAIHSIEDNLSDSATKFIKPFSQQIDIILSTYEKVPSNDVFLLESLAENLNETAQDISNSVLETISNKSTPESNIRLNDLGLPMHPLEIEIATMIEKTMKGEKIFPPYNRKNHENPLKYLEKYYGRFLKKFNGDKDYLYQFQLKKIDNKFRQTLATHLHRRDINVSEYILSKSDFVNEELEVSQSTHLPILDDKNVKKVGALKNIRHRRNRGK